MKTSHFLTLLFTVTIFAGCDPLNHGRQPSPAEPVPPVVATPEKPAPSPETASEPVPEPAVEPELVTIPAEAGVTGKGRYGQGGGEKPMDIVTVPVGTLFAAREKAVFDIQIPHALTLYKAANDNKGPDSHETFMRDVIQANMIALPQLPEGQEYLYDPETEQLMVRKPAGP